MPGWAAFIIDIAGAKLREARSHVDSILLFAVCRRRAVGDAQSARSAHGEKGGPVALWSPKPILPYCFFTICGGLAWELHGTGQHGKRSAPLLNLHQDQTKFWLHTGSNIPAELVALALPQKTGP
jgi:hypothetical protein